jgi:hypothetical protein
VLTARVDLRQPWEEAAGRHVNQEAGRRGLTGKVFMQETSKRNLGFFSIKVPGSQGYTLYDLKKETYSTRWVILVKVE